MIDLKNKLVRISATTAGVATTWAIMASSAMAQSFDAGAIKAPPIIDVTLPQMIGTVVNFALGLVGIIAVMYLIFGGITYVTAGGDSEKASKGRQTITNAIIGIVIILAALAIYNGVIVGAKSGAVR